jgi:hypothetical protein
MKERETEKSESLSLSLFFPFSRGARENMNVNRILAA